MGISIARLVLVTRTSGKDPVDITWALLNNFIVSNVETRAAALCGMEMVMQCWIHDHLANTHYQTAACLPMLKPLLDLAVRATGSKSGRKTVLYNNRFRIFTIGHEIPQLTPSNYGTSTWQVTTERGITTGSRELQVAPALLSNQVSCTSAGPQQAANEKGHRSNEGVTVTMEVIVSSANIEEPV